MNDEFKIELRAYAIEVIDKYKNQATLDRELPKKIENDHIIKTK
jgi:hypothetical protein